MNKVAPPSFEAMLNFAPIRWFRYSRIGRRISAQPRVKRFIQRFWMQWNMRIDASFDTSPLEQRREPLQNNGREIRADKTSTISTRFIVLSEGRSGSTLLVDELGRRWSEIRSRREVFHRMHWEDTSFEEIAHAAFIADTGHSIVGCKIFSPQVSDDQLTQLLKLDGMRVIILRRRNLLRRYVSLRIAQRTQLWIESEGKKVPRPSLEERRITIDTDDFYLRTMTTFAHFRRFEKMAASVPSTHVYYEDLSADLNSELRRIATFLGADEPSRESPPILTRQNPEPLEDLILNFSEVCDFLADVGMSEFITMGESAHETESLPATLRCWPTPSQMELFSAVLGPEILFAPRWDKWLSQTRAWTFMEDLDGLQPMIYQRLRLSKPHSPSSHEFQTDAIRTTASNLRFRTHVAEILDRLQNEGINATLAGDVALAFTLSTTSSHSMMFQDFDLIPHSEHFRATVESIERQGWKVLRSADHRPDGVTLQLDDVEDLNPIEITVTHQVLPSPDHVFLNEALLENAVRASDESIGIRTLTTGDLLLAIIVDGLLTRPARSVQWIPRSHEILKSLGETIDWDRFIGLTQHYDLSPTIQKAFELLVEISPDLVDPQVLAALHALPVSDEQWATFHAAMTP